MPRDGSGNYQLPAGQPVVTNTPVSSTVFNTLTADVQTALTNSIAKDGQTTPTANLPMGGNKHTNIADGSARNQYASVGQVQDGSMYVAGSITGVDVITGSLTPAITGVVNNMMVIFVPAGSNTSVLPTLSLNGLAAKTIVKFSNSPLAPGDLVGSLPAVVIYSSGVNAWVLLNPATISASVLTDGSVTYAKLQVIPTDSLLGRATAGTGAVERLPISSYMRGFIQGLDAAAARSVLGLGNLATQNGTFSGVSSGTNTGDQTDVPGTSGSFTGTVVGLTTSPTFNVRWSKSGNEVNLNLDAFNSFGTSNSITLTVTGMPAGIRPSVQTAYHAVSSIFNNGADALTPAMYITTGGVITFLNGNSETGFTASGTKGIPRPIAMSYTLS